MFQMARKPLAHMHSLAYSHSGAFIASVDEGGFVKVWDGKSGAFVAEYQGHDDKVKSVAWTRDDIFVVFPLKMGQCELGVSWICLDCNKPVDGSAIIASSSESCWIAHLTGCYALMVSHISISCLRLHSHYTQFEP